MSQYVETILSDLVAIPSVTSDRVANERILDYTQAFLAEQGMHIARRNHNGYGSLVATTQETMTPDVMLVGHADVVTAEPEQFELREEDGKLYGRGAIDMKGSLAAYLAVAQELGQLTAKYNFGIKVVTNEEIGGSGVKDLLDEGFVPRAAVLIDSGRDWQLQRVAKGAWTTRVLSHGRAAHGSRPWDGDSATFKLLDLLGEVRQLFGAQSAETDTLNISLLSGGEAQNQVPAEAQATLDIRLTGQQSYASISRQVLDICARYGADPKVIAFFPPVEHDMSDPYITRFADSVEAVTGVVHQGGIVSLGASDATQYVSRGIPCAVTKPPGGDEHGPREWIEQRGLHQLVAVLHNYLDQVCKVSS